MDEHSTSPDNDHLKVLLTEFEASADAFDKSQGYLLQILSIGIPAAAGLIGYIVSGQITLTLWVASVLPLTLLFFYGLVIYIMYLRLKYYWDARILETRINLMLPEISIIRSVRHYPGARFFSSRRGSIKFNGLYNLLGWIAGILLAVLIYICFSSIYSVNHFLGVLFLVANALIAGFEGMALASLSVDMPGMYDQLMDKVIELKRMPKEEEIKQILDRSLQASRNAFFLALLPRPWDVTAKGLYFWYGFFFAYIMSGVDAKTLPVLTALFGPASLWSKANEAPFWAVCVFGVIFFVLEELVLQQAKLLWDDIRDRDRDRQLPLNTERAIATGALNGRAARSNLVVRLGIAFVVGYLLGGFPITLVFAAILLHQAFYVLWAKPRAEQHPKRLVFLLSLNTSLRFIAGVVVVGGLSPLSTLLISLIIAINYFHSLANSCLLWRIEVEKLEKENLPATLRPQAPFFVAYGRRLQFYALVSVLLIGGSLALYFAKYPPLQWIDQNSKASGLWFLPLLVIPALGLISGLIYFISYLLSCAGSALRRVRFLDRYTRAAPGRLEGAVKGVRVSASLLGSLLMAIGLLGVIYYLIKGDVLYAVLSYLLHNFGFMLSYENMDFDDYTMKKLKEQFAVFRILLPIYLFVPDSKLTLAGLFAILLDYNKALEAKRYIENNYSSFSM